MASSRRRRHSQSRPATVIGPRIKRSKTKPPVTLPDELIVEVLLRLPAKSLATLRRVCHSWDVEISSRSFQQRHHALAATRFAFLPLAPSHGAFFGFGRTRHVEKLVSCKDCPRVVGSKPCHGVVLVKRPCLAEGGYSICNPTTGEILHLPLSDYGHFVIGMGFHAPVGEFKVVQVDMESRKVDGRVLTVGDSRGWRAPAATGNNQALFHDFTGYTTLDAHVQPVFADGCIHWSFRTSYMYADKPHGILSFSLADESFRQVPQPPFSTADLVPYDQNTDHEHKDKIWKGRHGTRSENGEKVHVPLGQTLAELDGRLCMMCDIRHRSDLGSLFEIWKLEDYDTGSWSLDYRINVTPGHTMAEWLRKPWLVVPLRYLDRDDSSGEKRKLLLATTAQEAHVYDPDSGTLQMVASVAKGGNSDDSLRLVLYQESLFRFAGMKHHRGEIEFVKVD
ncbi:hypothetical protein QOZ80_3BG0262470 [Eleusine coracana subsp. coracana]|nr:hypothetical protein QOZ80_3BG0262470 [Eleusine coracana subsp. coracana]